MEQEARDIMHRVDGCVIEKIVNHRNDHRGASIPCDCGAKARFEGYRSKQPAGSAKTREVKLGCVFTQTTVDEKGRAVRDANSTTYTGAIETAEEFGPRIYAEAARRGLNGAQKVVVLGDGAPWIWNIADEQFHGAVQIVDIYHAREHPGNLSKLLFKESDPMRKKWYEKAKSLLGEGEIERLVKKILSLKISHKQHEKAIVSEAEYFAKNKERMRYAEFRDQGLFVGSGVVEAGCKAVIGQRLKLSGMRWTVNGANAIISLRCCLLSGKWVDYWEQRACA